MNDYLSFLGTIAKISNGYAAIFNEKGEFVKSVDGDGNNIGIDNWQQVLQYISEKGPIKKPVEVAIDATNGASAWLMPIKDIIIAVSNSTAKKEEKQLRTNFEEALPLIAQVAGGEAALFDNNGRRLIVYWSDGRIGPGIGEVSPKGKMVMDHNKPFLGPSALEEGVLSIRVPVTREFGFGFNNLDTVRRKRQLLQTHGHRWNAEFTFNDIIGSSEKILTCKVIAKKYACNDSTVMISGETGTGKEMFAQAIHNESSRKNGPFVAVNCGAMPSTLIESYLFGYEAGAFTGARKQGQKGIFEEAYGGTIFLDEISEMEYSLQVGLLRVLQERKVVRIGGNKTVEVDVRVIVATNRDLIDLVKQKRFREDLYYRLNVLELHIPPLRERPEDIEALANYFLDIIRKRQNHNIKRIDSDAMHHLMKYSWPGNIRQMQNVILKSINACDEVIICSKHLPILISAEHEDIVQSVRGEKPHIEYEGVLNKLKMNQKILLKNEIIKAFEEEGLNRRKVAKRLGMSTVSLWRKMKELGIV